MGLFDDMKNAASSMLAGNAAPPVARSVLDLLTPGGQMPTGPSLEQGLSALRSKLGL